MPLPLQYSDVPKDPVQNVRCRRALLAAAAREGRNAEAIYLACSRDVLYWLNMFGWTYNPKDYPSEPIRAFITYDYQDGVLQRISKAIGHHDLLIKKARDMGATWLILSALTHAFVFRDMQSFMLGSWKEDYVDKTGSPSSLFWKVEYLISQLPQWMRPDVHRTFLHMQNRRNGSVIEGEATTGDLGRAGRTTATFLDEFAAVPNGHAILRATRDTTRCRLFCSTFQGTGNAFYDLTQGEIEQIPLHWSIHPEKNVGLHEVNGKLRSPWYDGECARSTTASEIAQELDMDPFGSTSQFFDEEVLQRVILEDVRSCQWAGELSYDHQTGDPIEFLAAGFQGSARLRLWFEPVGPDRGPPPGQYGAGIDVATGTGGKYASNSAISIVNRVTGEKVAEFAWHRINPGDLAVYAVALCRWFFGAFLIWEANGPGRSFGDKVQELGYANIYFRRDDNSIKKKVSTFPGWWNAPESARSLFDAYKRALADRTFKNPSEEAVRECRAYILQPNGKVAHDKSLSAVDAADAGPNHGDRVVADALARKIVKEYPGTEKDGPREIPVGSLAWRKRKVEVEIERAGRW